MIKTLAESLAFRYSHKGNRFIRYKLAERGFPESIISDAIAGLDDEYQRALTAAHHRVGRSSQDNPDTIETLFSFFKRQKLSF